MGLKSRCLRSWKVWALFSALLFLLSAAFTLLRIPAIIDKLALIIYAPDPAPLSIVPAVTVATFKNDAPALLESIVIDAQGNIFVTIGNTGEIRKVALDGTQSTLAILPSGKFGLRRFEGVLGTMVIDSKGTIYATLVAMDPENRGVWQITPDGTSRLWAKLPPRSQPNGITMDKQNNLFVADSYLGLVWRVAHDSRKAGKWIDHDLLKRPVLGFLPGPNGLKFWNNALYVSNSSKGTIIRIPVQPNGSAGEPDLYVKGISADDFAFDEKGNMYLTTHPFNSIFRISPNGSRAIIAKTAQGVVGPTAAVFGALPEERDKLFVVNDGGFVVPTPGAVPNIVRLDIGIPGLPIP